MSKALPLICRALAALILAGVLAAWIAGGAHRGWSMDQVPLKKTDEVTGLEYVEYEDRFVAGLDVLAGGIGAAVVLFGASFLFRKPESKLKSKP